MRLLILFVFSLLSISTAFAATYCPATITCNYNTGVCDKPDGWVVDDSQARELFTGSQTMKLSKIWAYKQGSSSNEVYQFECTYYYGNDGSAISLYKYVKQLSGTAWAFSGFGKQHAECSIADPSACTGE